MGIFSDGIEVAGSTDPLNDDTDGDNLLDGIEDANLNGVVDPEETSPILIDTDADAVNDDVDNCPITFNPEQDPSVCAAVPVTLVAFSGQVNGAVVNLFWSTSSEINNEGYEIQHSMDAEQFQQVGWVPGAINSSELLHYTYNHTSPEAGVNYYRLRQLDTDGVDDFSDVIAVEVRGVDHIALFPNPAGDVLNIRGVNGVPSLISITNVNGQLIQHSTLQNNKVDISELPRGLFFVTITTETDKVVKKMVKK